MCVCVCVCVWEGGCFVLFCFVCLFVLSLLFLHVISSLGGNSFRLLTRVRSDPIVMFVCWENFQRNAMAHFVVSDDVVGGTFCTSLGNTMTHLVIRV